MKIAAHVLAYNVNRFLEPVLKNMSSRMDKIYITYSRKPWGYNEQAYKNKTNPTSLSYVKKISDKYSHVEIIKENLTTEEDCRNKVLSKAREENFDWFIVQDTDEFYPDETWNDILKALKKGTNHDLFKTTLFNFWKSSQYVLLDQNGNIKGTIPSFAIRCKSNINFLYKRVCSSKKTRIIDCPCFHYGYALTNKEMKEKISTWGHAHQLYSKYWYRYKWLNWSKTTRYLHPTYPYSWQKALQFPNEQPDFAHQFALPVKEKSPALVDRIGEFLFDQRIKAHHMGRNFKRLIK